MVGKDTSIISNLKETFKFKRCLKDTFSHLKFIRTCLWPGEGNGTPLRCSCLENPMDGGAGRLQSMGSLESDMTERLHFRFSLSCIGEGNGNPLQYYCLENPMDGGAGRLQSMGSLRVGHD